MEFSKRNFLVTGGVIAAAAAIGFRAFRPKEAAAAEQFKISKTDDEWRQELTVQQYNILRKAATETPGSSPLDAEKRVGLFVCAGCENRLFSSRHKFESGTGWPSFWQPLDAAVGQKTDYLIGYPRTEIHCADCGGHLGHVFSDGPRPTGKRYCMNGAAMEFWVNDLVEATA